MWNTWRQAATEVWKNQNEISDLCRDYTRVTPLSSFPWKFGWGSKRPPQFRFMYLLIASASVEHLLRPRGSSKNYPVGAIGFSNERKRMLQEVHGCMATQWSSETSTLVESLKKTEASSHQASASKSIPLGWDCPRALHSAGLLASLICSLETCDGERVWEELGEGLGLDFLKTPGTDVWNSQKTEKGKTRRIVCGGIATKEWSYTKIASWSSRLFSKKNCCAVFWACEQDAQNEVPVQKGTHWEAKKG